ncbi:MAG: hypothetical protein R3C59_16945 [Planctomycetaceae bacterium]
MGDEVSGVCVGYSVFDVSDECYAYNEDACYVAATRESADAFREACDIPSRAARIERVMLDDLVSDFGCSSGEYAMEAAAYARFQQLAEQHCVGFEAEAYDRSGSLMVVQLD